MKVTRLNLQNFRPFRELELHLHPRLNVLVGVNGVGKSAILDAIAILLVRLQDVDTARFASKDYISEDDIYLGQHNSLVEIDVSRSSNTYSWNISCDIQARRGISYNLKGVGSLIAEIKRSLEENRGASIPIAVLYSTNRPVSTVSLEPKPGPFDQVAAFVRSLTVKSSLPVYNLFFEWFRSREDVENENRRYLQDAFKPDDWEFPDRQLEAVRSAVKFLTGFSDLQVRRKPRLRMVVNKSGREFRIEQLSDGEKCLLAMVGDLARRLAMANPSLQNPLEGEGVVLIDEIELHLHPKWQREIIPGLLRTFPNCQFIVSTHSPQVLGEVDAECIHVLTVDEETGDITCTQPPRSKGLESGEVLTEIMDARSRNKDVEEALTTIFDLIDDAQFLEAENKIQALEKDVGEIPELIKAKTMMALLAVE